MADSTTNFSQKQASLEKKTRIGESLIHVVLFACALCSIFTTVGIVVILASQSALFFADPQVTLLGFFTSFEWQPSIGKFGILPLLNATLLTSFIAVVFATPFAILVAIFLSEFTKPRIKAIIKPILEVLAGIPSVVYGYFAVGTVTPVLQRVFGSDTVEFYNTASAGIVIGILILPILITMIDDSLTSVPNNLREASFGLGATRLQTSFGVVIPGSFSGIAAAFILGFSRAIGETMIVALAAGAGSALTWNPFRGAETMTGYIVRISGGDISYNSIDYNSIFAIGLVLFLATLGLNIISRRIVKKYQWNV